MAARQPHPEDDEQHRMTVNLAAIIVALVIIIAGFWLIISLKEAVKSEECLMFGLRSCAKLGQR